jgi:hypothetical protein
VAAALLALSAVLLVAAGTSKVVQPDPAADALGVAGLPSSPLLVRCGALAEALLGIAALIWAGVVIDALVALSFVAFAGFVELLRRRPDAESCGCFGGEGEVPSLRHVVGNLLLAAGCVVAAVLRAPSAVAVLRHSAGVGGSRCGWRSLCSPWQPQRSRCTS